MHEEGSDVWVLKIQETRLADSGQYECQVGICKYFYFKIILKLLNFFWVKVVVASFLGISFKLRLR